MRIPRDLHVSFKSTETAATLDKANFENWACGRCTTKQAAHNMAKINGLDDDEVTEEQFLFEANMCGYKRLVDKSNRNWV